MTILGFDWPTWIKVAIDILIIILAAAGGHASGARKARKH